MQPLLRDLVIQFLIDRDNAPTVSIYWLSSFLYDRSSALTRKENLLTCPGTSYHCPDYLFVPEPGVKCILDCTSSIFRKAVRVPKYNQA